MGTNTNGSAIFIPGVNDSTSDTLRYANTQSDNDHRYQFRVGINTHVPRSGLDLGGFCKSIDHAIIGCNLFRIFG